MVEKAPFYAYLRCGEHEEVMEKEKEKEKEGNPAKRLCHVIFPFGPMA